MSTSSRYDHVTQIPNLDTPANLQALNDLFKTPDFNDYLEHVIGDRFMTAANQFKSDQSELFKKQITQTKLAVWKQFIDDIDTLIKGLTSLRSTDADADAQFIDMLVNAIRITDSHLESITKKINENVKYIETYEIIKVSGVFRRPIVSWYIESILKENGIFIKQKDNAIQGVVSFSDFFNHKKKFYIVHDDVKQKKNARWTPYFDAQIERAKRENPTNTNDPYFKPPVLTQKEVTLKHHVFEPTDTFCYSNDDRYDRESNPVVGGFQFYVTECDPRFNYQDYHFKGVDSENTCDLNGFIRFLSRIYSEIWHSENDHYVPALFIHGDYVTSCENALIVLQLFANRLSLGVPARLHIYPKEKLIEEARHFFDPTPQITDHTSQITQLTTNDNGTPDSLFKRATTRLGRFFNRNRDKRTSGGSKKRSSKKTHRGRNKSNNSHKYRGRPRSRRSISKYHKKTARKT